MAPAAVNVIAPMKSQLAACETGVTAHASV
jgi:hypothetical protein